jgi:hypothetical protein
MPTGPRAERPDRLPHRDSSSAPLATKTETVARRLHAHRLTGQAADSVGKEKMFK